MGTKKGSRICRHTFDDDKQFLLPDGRPFEDVPMRECAIHYDDNILCGLAAQVITQEVQDWQKLNKGGKKDYAHCDGGNVWRYEILNFFNGTFCGAILELFVPELTQEEALMNMNMMDFNRRQIGTSHRGLL